MATAAGALSGRRVLVTGAGGQLGGYLLGALAAANAIPIGLGARPGPGVDAVADITDPKATRRQIGAIAPVAIIHAAAYTDVDSAERNPDRAEAVNGAGSRHVAEAARDLAAHLLAVGSDYVFAGDGDGPYAEDGPTNPLSAYGRSKLAGERAVLEADPAFAVVRTAWLYGGPGKHFPRTVLTVLRDRGSIDVVDDETGSPTFAADLAGALVALLAIRAAGLFHLANEGRTTRYHLARAVAAAAGLDPARVRPTTTAAFLVKYPLPARRPADSSLINTRAAALGLRLRPWRAAIDAYDPCLAAEPNITSSGDPPHHRDRQEA